ncbi:hypothetical protein [Clostridium felsineum]|uniref:hypothetical protein n=1 Tax=Clostridium felsineum TaxID=36839 RepID=UPI00098C75D6|nr:hypothetical protein [Clostridium felsineum]URZ15079.1 Adenosine deaminase [Clostridium felsineum DSM 794]
MNNGLFIQKLKILTYPFSSYYSYINPDFMAPFVNEISDVKLKINGEKKNIDISIDEIFNDIREGFYTTKIDSIKSIIYEYWNLNNVLRCNGNNISVQYCCEDILLHLNSIIGNNYFDIRNGKIFISGKNRNKVFNKNQIEIGENYNHKFEWYALKHLIDMDTVKGSFISECGFDELEDMCIWNSPVFTTDTLLDNVLEKGVAELHMHMGAAKDFIRIWMWLMNNVKRKDNVLNKIKIKTIDGVIEFKNYIKVAQIIRLIMSIYLNNVNGTFGEFVNSIDDKFKIKNRKLERPVKWICEKFLEGYKFHNEDIYFNNIFNGIRDEYNIDYKSIDYNYDKDYSQIILKNDILTYIFSDFYRFKNDVIYELYRFKGTLYPEYIFNSKAIEYMKINGEEYFKKIFWQYVKIKNIVYKYIVQQHTAGKGLDLFSKIYSRQSSFYNRYYTEELLYSQLNNQNIKKLEIRCSPNENESRVKSNLLNIFRGYKSVLKNYKDDNSGRKNTIPSIGIVFHFIKEYKGIKDKCFYSDSEEKQKGYIHYDDLSEKYARQAEVISKIRKDIPWISNYIVGIDAASKENDTEPYVFVKAYKILRQHKNMKTSVKCEKHFISDIGFTYHVGEEFRSIVSGIRHIDEVIEKLGFKSGDRLGHAIVIGLDIDKWAEINTSIYMPVGEYFENLLWEWGLYTKDENYKDLENISYLENHIFQISESIFGFTDGLTVRDLYRGYLKKFNGLCNRNNSKFKKCKLKEFTKKKYYSENDAEFTSSNFDFDNIVWSPNLINQAIQCEYFLKNMKKTLTINVNSVLISKYKKLQEYMKKKISERGIIIETNPTSNLIIGDFSTFEDYHITNLSSPEKEDVIVTINTDDPVVFNTRINNEFSLIYDILMKKGKYSSKQIIEWLDKIRLNGLNYSFIKDRGLTKDEILKEVNEIIEKLVV